ncbi:6-phosphofructose-aspartate deglycase [Symbiopectobacterium purcellii]|uniref:6-phosphofructose-aspartate deglycase n=1 Tax=Symbiopectobacterium purcellii TaxID=2871826 RepID=A0ABX9AIR5_9ENTR|nr:6-phosphofructose-aspartate deglycase [Symbiopectobacterium purcellii]QZN95050.1 6-phosphofructose-aspartate deglycase [Symbiopectobacterium purcellii]
MSIQQIISDIVASKTEKGGVKHVYYVACGGSYAAFYPAKAFIEKEAKTVSVGLYNSGEFIHNPPVALGEDAIVVVASHKGNTPETIQAAALAQSRGVPVIGLTWVMDSPLVAHCDFVESYSFGDGKDIAQEKTLKGLISAVEILHQTEGYAAYDDFQDGLSKINRIVYRACEHLSKRAAAFAQEYKDDKVIYTMASGAGYGAAYLQSICIFMEMQWIHSACIHSGEFFHGPFEITDANTPFFFQFSEGSTRAVDERALNFLKKYGRRIEVVDAKELGLSTIKPSVIDYFNHSLFNNVYPVYNRALAEVRQHPLTTRRYMWKVEY